MPYAEVRDTRTWYELRGEGQCVSTGETGARASWVMDQCLITYYGER